MKIKLLTAAVALLGSSGYVFANDTYRGEVEVGYGEHNQGALDNDHYNIQGRFYFEDVNTRNHPLAEAAFLEQSSYVELGYKDITGKDGLYKQDSDSFNGEVTFYIPNTLFMVGAGYTEFESKNSLGVRVKDNYWTAKVGIAPVDGLLVWTNFIEDIDYSDSVNIHAKYVTPLSEGTALNIEGSVEKIFEDRRYSVAGDYYFDRNLSLGLGYAILDQDVGSNRDQYEVRARNFFTDKFNVSVAYVNDDGDDGFRLGAALRF